MDRKRKAIHKFKHFIKVLIDNFKGKVNQQFWKRKLRLLRKQDKR